ncbi:RNA recognition motif domain [Dillenia turbinata]|uniref:RNA recognition motif domain n=1 Tax=Dillenia turbinata TaxID=194707 RepID=A0AAN8Z9H8_9MAGN
MNPLTLVKRIQQINSKEAALGLSEEASWHAKYKDSAYIFIGGVPFDLTEGDLLAVFAQYGEIVDVNLVRDKGTGKSKGFAFLAYEDQRSTNLAVDNLNGAQVLGRIIRVDHVSNYKKKEEEDEEAEQQKREARGVCRAFQRGECNRGAGCKFSHDEQRAANTGWGQQDNGSRWAHDNYDGATKGGGHRSPVHERFRPSDKDLTSSRGKGNEGGRDSHYKRRDNGNWDQDVGESDQGLKDKRDHDRRESVKRSEVKEMEISQRDFCDRRVTHKRSLRLGSESNPQEDRDRTQKERSRKHGLELDQRGDVDKSKPREDHGRSDEKRSRRYDEEIGQRETLDKKTDEKRLAHHKYSSQREMVDDYRRGSRR